MKVGVQIKATLILIVSLVLIFGALSFFLIRQETTRLRSDLVEQTTSFAQFSVRSIGETFLLYRESGSIRIEQQINRFLDLNPDIVNIAIASIDGRRVFTGNGDSNGHPDVQISEEQIRTFETREIRDQDGQLIAIVQPFIEDFGAHRYSVIFYVSTERIDEEIRQVVQLIISIGLTVTIISLALTMWLLNRFFLKPLTGLSRSANRISLGDLNHQIKASRQDEIGDLAKSVNSMAQSLKSDIIKLRETDRLKTEFLMLASHNLRSPLTTIEGQLDTANSSKTLKQAKDALDTIKKSNDQLRDLSEDLLAIATFESGQKITIKEPARLSDLLEKLKKNFTQMAGAKGQTFRLESKLTNEKANINSHYFSSAIMNLLDNAHKFTDKGGKIELEAFSKGNKAYISVRDNGIGIPIEEQSKLFTKFHRGSSTEEYNYEGLGVGLYLTKLIVEQHGGSVSLASQPGHGSTFIIEIPLINEKSG